MTLLCDLSLCLALLFIKLALELTWESRWETLTFKKTNCASQYRKKKIFMKNIKLRYKISKPWVGLASERLCFLLLLLILLGDARIFVIRKHEIFWVIPNLLSTRGFWPVKEIYILEWDKKAECLRGNLKCVN